MPNDPDLDALADHLRGELALIDREPLDQENVLATARRRARGLRRRRRVLTGAGAACGVAVLAGTVAFGAGLRGATAEGTLAPAASSTGASRVTTSPTATHAPKTVRQSPDGPRGYDLPALFPQQPVHGIGFVQRGSQNALAPAFENQTCSLFPQSRRHDGVRSGTDQAPAAMVSQTQVKDGVRARITISDPGGGVGYANILQASSYCHFTEAQPVTRITGAWDNPREGNRRTYVWKAAPGDGARSGSDTGVGTTVEVGALLVTASAQASDPQTARDVALALSRATADRITKSGYAYQQSRYGETVNPQWRTEWKPAQASTDEPAPRGANVTPEVVQ